MFSSIQKTNNNDEKLHGLKLNFGIDFSGPKQFSFQTNIMAFNIYYNGNTFSSIGHDMLEGLSNGRGLEMHILISKSINQNNLSIQYNGRVNEERIIHGARFELKRYF